MASPYQIAGVRASLADLMQKSNLQQQQSQRATSKQMGEMQEVFEDEIEKLQSDARKKGILNAIKIAGSIFGTPIISALTGAAVSGKTLYDQKRGAEMLLNKDMQERYGNTFLRGGMKDFTRMAEDAQISSGDIARGAFGSGLSSMVLSKLMGADKDSSVYDRYKEGREASKILKSDEFSSSLENFTDYELNNGTTLGMQKQQNVLNRLLNEKGFDNVDFLRASEVAKSSFPGITNILESVTGGEGLKTGMENLQSAIMLPMLLQQLLGE